MILAAGLCRCIRGGSAPRSSARRGWSADACPSLQPERAIAPRDAPPVRLRSGPRHQLHSTFSPVALARLDSVAIRVHSRSRVELRARRVPDGATSVRPATRAPDLRRIAARTIPAASLSIAAAPTAAAGGNTSLRNRAARNPTAAEAMAAIKAADIRASPAHIAAIPAARIARL